MRTEGKKRKNIRKGVRRREGGTEEGRIVYVEKIEKSNIECAPTVYHILTPIFLLIIIEERGSDSLSSSSPSQQEVELGKELLSA